MDDSSQGSRRRLPPRPGSSASNITRMTPSSSNSSAANLPRSSTMRGALGGTSLLQERLRERKVESARQKRRSVDMSVRTEVQSSPIRLGSTREDRRPSSSGISSKGMGVKQIEEQVSTLHKQNFDLKLELYHRRQRQEALETQLESAEKQLEDQAEMQEVNEQLLAELERRDQALDEAVGVIVNLEEKIDKMLQEREMVRQVDEELTYDQQPPPQKPIKSKSMMKMPSFLSEQSEGTEALRSLYLPHSQSYSDATLPKLAEEGSVDAMDSPRLSVLSESSFLSIYGEKQISLDEPDSPSSRKHRASSSVEKWIDERPVIKPSPPLLRNKQYLSINDVLESPLQRLEKLKQTLEKHNRLPSDRFTGQLVRIPTKGGYEHVLPPTPDTISTNTLRHYKDSNDTLAEDINGKFSNSTSIFPVPGASYNAYQSALSVRPRSAGETVTSRRDGHGWDTETQGDLTETASLTSTASTYNANTRPRVTTPNLFTFGDEKDWGRDVFNADPQLPAHTAKRYERLRRSSMIEPRSDDTVVYQTAVVRYDDRSTPIDISPRPDPPDRRSSLSAVSKLRNGSVSAAMATGSPVTQNPSPPKKSRLAGPLRLFGRSDTGPCLASTQYARVQRPKNGSRSQSYYEPGHGNGTDNEEVARATPPPIRRNRTHAPRPSSAGIGVARRPITFGYDGAGDDDVGHERAGSVDVAAEEEGKSTGRKWFGNLRRN